MKTIKNSTFFIITVSSYLIFSYILNGIDGNWSIIYLLKDSWVGKLGIFVGYGLLEYTSSQK